MTREKIRQKQIEEAVSTSITETLMSTPNYEFSPRATDLLECAFWKGAEWADENPANPWHSVKDGELPQEAKDCIFCYQGELYKGFMLGDKTIHFDEVFSPDFNIYDVDYWIEIPELPTE